MMNAKRQIEILEKKLSALQTWNQKYSIELQSIQNEIRLLKKSISSEKIEIEEPIENVETNFEHSKSESQIPEVEVPPVVNYRLSYRFVEENFQKAKPTINLEKFIGENLINKIGILITIIGIGIGASYAIEHNLINPLTRILLGYLSGIVILGTSYKLKEKYENFSSVLLGGGFSVLYFMTFFAYSFYDLLPQWLAFVIMCIITGLTVFSSLKFAKQVIAHLGLVGAYAVPFLLSDNSGNVVFLFSYMTLVNIGILLISINKYWKSLYYSAFSFTYLIYIFWLVGKYSFSEHFLIANIFIIIFFGIFHVVFLAYKLRTNEQFKAFDLGWLFVNSFIFYFLTMSIFDSNNFYEQFDGSLTFSHAIMHFLIYLLIRKKELSNKNLEKFVLGLAISFVTITIPVQFDGYWVTALWIAEATLLFWFSSKNYDKLFEYFSYSMIVLSFLSLLFDWDSGYKIFEVHKLKENFNFIVNINFLNSFIFIIGLGIINYLKNKDKKIISIEDDYFKDLISFSISGLLFVVIYIAIGLEISLFWQQLFQNSAIETANDNFNSLSKNFDWLRYHDVCLMLYSIIYASIFTLLNAKKYKIESLIKVNLSINFILYLIFVFSGTFLLYLLSVSFLDNKIDAQHHHSIFNVIIKYISYSIFALLFYTSHFYFKQKLASEKFLKLFDLLIYFAIFWIVSYELITWMNYLDSPHTFKLGLSILWGILSSIIIAIGIWKKKKHLRIFAISLFGITLLKLFFIDASHLATIPKTILFVTLGVLLLAISFLYNKYKYLINDKNENIEPN